MSYTIDFLEDEGIVIIEENGELVYEDFVKQSQGVIELGRKKNAQLFLVDCTRLIAHATTLQLHDFPSMYEKLGMPRTSKVAVLMPKDALADKDVRFYETVCRNRGWQVSVFDVKDAAVKWLMGKFGT